MTFKPSEGQKNQPFYAYDRIRDVQVGSFLNNLMGNMGALRKRIPTISGLLHR